MTLCPPGRSYTDVEVTITVGRYISPYADKKVKPLGSEPPPMMWIFEWDIVGGDSATLDTIYRLSKPHIDASIVPSSRARERLHRALPRPAGTVVKI